MMKTRLRNKIKKYQIDPLNRINYDKIITDALISIIKPNTKVGCYRKIFNEVNIDAIFSVNLYELYAPVTTDKIVFRYAPSLDSFKYGKFGVMEPLKNVEVKVQDLDYIVIPALAYNTKGFRLGYGHGFYDKALENYSGIKIGCIYSLFLVKDNFQEIFDLKVDYIITEKGIIKIGD